MFSFPQILTRYKYPGTIYGILILFAIVAGDLTALLTNGVVVIFDYGILREALIVVSFILLGMKIVRFDFFQDTNVLKRIKSILILFSVLLSIAAASYFLLLSPFKSFPKDSILKNIAILLNESVFSYVGTYLYLLIFWLYKDLIFFKQKPSTVRNYVGLVAVIGVELLLVLILPDFESKDLALSSDNFSWEQIKVFFKTLEILDYIFIPIVVAGIFYLFANLFRVSWVTYLSKTQKLTALWQFTLIFILASIFSSANKEALLINEFSPLLSKLWESLNAFFIFYPLFSICYIILHLPTARLFDKKLKEISTLHEIGQSVISVINPHEIGEKVVQILPEIIECKIAWIELYEPTKGVFTVGASANISKKEIEESIQNSEGILRNWILKHNKGVLINELMKDERVKEFKKLGGKSNALLAAPIESKNGLIGILFASSDSEFAFDSEDLTMINSFANQVSMAFENANLVSESLEKERLEQEFQIAYSVQQRLFPQKLPKVEELEIGAFSIPATELGGDYYDLVRTKDNRLLAVIADVSGKGASAAFYMAETKGIVKSLAKDLASPKKFLGSVNEIISESLAKNMFITMTAGIFNLETMEFGFVRAGHCPLIYFDSEKGKAELLSPKGMGVGLVKGAMIEKFTEEQTLQLKENDILVFYTDGISEARNPEGEEYGEEKILELIEAKQNESAEVLVHKIKRDVGNFVKGVPHFDDVTLIVIKVKSKIN
ncbi:MAG: GAF domain-containing protein [Calditrichaeota bacterium]|nr:MAG: GAF domain-containing protein [Calditrichota bacterium]